MIDATAPFFFGLGFVAATLIKLTWWMARVEYWSRRAKRMEKERDYVLLHLRRIVGP